MISRTRNKIDSDHGANDGPTVGAAPDEAVRGGLSAVARGVGTGLAAGAAALRKLSSTVADDDHATRTRHGDRR